MSTLQSKPWSILHDLSLLVLFLPLSPSSFTNLTFWHALNLTVVTLEELRLCLPYDEAEGEQQGDFQDAITAKKLCSNTTVWVVWTSCLLCSPCLMAVYSQGHKDLRYITLMGNWDIVPWTAGIFHYWKKNVIYTL